MTTDTVKDPRQFPVLRNLHFSPIKEGEEQYVVLWDPSGLSKEKLVLPLNYFFIIQHFDGDHSLHVCNAPSPAATASIPIGRAVAQKIPAPSRPLQVAV